MCPRAEQMETEFITAEQRRAWGKWAKQCQTWWSCSLTWRLWVYQLCHFTVPSSYFEGLATVTTFRQLKHLWEHKTTALLWRFGKTSRSTLTSTRSRWGACLHADTTNSQRLINRATTRGTWLVCLLLQDNIFVHVLTESNFGKNTVLTAVWTKEKHIYLLEGHVLQSRLWTVGDRPLKAIYTPTHTHLFTQHFIIFSKVL